VTERGASTTAVLVCQGRASADGRYAVGRFSDPIARELLDPADRDVVDRVRAGDEPPQRDKLRRVSALAPVAERVFPVAVDLTSERLAGPLDAAGFDRHAASTWVWEGVVPYLTAADVRATLAQLPELTSSGSRLVINYQARSLPTTVMRKTMRLVLRLSGQPDPRAQEPWRSLWRPDDLRNLLGVNGYSVTSDSDLLTGFEALDLPSENNGSLRNGRVAIAVRD
jgi:O-methyltransferase involved in polyketide biosynthesis